METEVALVALEAHRKDLLDKVLKINEVINRAESEADRAKIYHRSLMDDMEQLDEVAQFLRDFPGPNQVVPQPINDSDTSEG